MTSSRPSAAAASSATATRSTTAALSTTARRLTRVTPHGGAVSSPFAARTGSSSVPATAQSPSQVPRLLAANLATLATAATASQTDCTHHSTSASHTHHHTHSHSHHHHHHHHHSPYHPYLKPSTGSVRATDSGDDEADDDDDVFLLPARKHQVASPPPKPQFHPQHHHRLITARPSTSSSSHKMPRRKETKKILLDVPSSEASRGIEGDPHQVFKCNGSPIISPRSIRNSLAETDCDVDGNPRPQKIAATTTAESSGGRTSQPSSAVLGPARPPSNDLTASPATSVNGSLKKPRRRRIGDSRPSTPNKSPTANGSDSSKHSDMDMLALKVAEQSLAGMSGVQLWVHRMLYTHHQTLHMLGIERGDFPNTRLSMKQLETMLAPVISLANLMTPAHFGIHVPTPQIAQTMSDVHYWKLWESDTIDIGIFFMPPNSHIPLHNHPGMSVVTRILYGSVNIRSYDLVSPDDDVLKAIENGASAESSESADGATSTDIVGADPKVMYARVSREGPYPAESTMWLDPRRFNLHQIHAASENGCAMLDIMIPPYNNADRDCHHFKILEEQYVKDKNERIVKMIESISKGNHNEPTASSRDAPTATAPSS